MGLCPSPALEAAGLSFLPSQRLLGLCTLGPAVWAPVAPRCRLWDAEGSSGEVLQPRGGGADTGSGKGYSGIMLKSSKALRSNPAFAAY